MKDRIIRGGENIYPREIEDCIFTHPKAAEAAVFGVPDEFYGEEAAAWVQLHEGLECTEQDIREFCEGNLAHFKIPKWIRLVAAFPMTAIGKLHKYRLREIMIEDLGRSRQ